MLDLKKKNSVILVIGRRKRKTKKKMGETAMLEIRRSVLEKCYPFVKRFPSSFKTQRRLLWCHAPQTGSR